MTSPVPRLRETFTHAQPSRKGVSSESGGETGVESYECREGVVERDDPWGCVCQTR